MRLSYAAEFRKFPLPFSFTQEALIMPKLRAPKPSAKPPAGIAGRARTKTTHTGYTSAMRSLKRQGKV
jgi:hypothetical protein